MMRKELEVIREELNKRQERWKKEKKKMIKTLERAWIK